MYGFGQDRKKHGNCEDRHLRRSRRVHKPSSAVTYRGERAICLEMKHGKNWQAHGVKDAKSFALACVHVTMSLIK